MNDFILETSLFKENESIVPIKAKISDINAIGDDNHDPEKPVFTWFQDTPIGKELFAVFYTKKCEWSRCSFCTLPSESATNTVSKKSIRVQCDYIFDNLNSWQKKSIKRVFLSNNGSILNQDIVSPESLRYICETAYKELPNLEIICLETRFETVEKHELEEHLSLYSSWHDIYRKSHRKCKEPVKLQISAGYETQDTFLRNKVLCKGYTEKQVVDFFELCKTVVDEHNEVNSRKIQILSDEYVMLKPAVGMTDKEAEFESFQTIAHLSALGDKYNVPVSVRLNPTFVAKGSELYDEFQKGKYTPPTLKNVVNVLILCHENKIKIPIFIGLNEEGLSVDQSDTFLRKPGDFKYMSALVEFNKNQDYEKLVANVDFDNDNSDPLTWKAIQGVNEILSMQRDSSLTNSELTHKLVKTLSNKNYGNKSKQYLIDIAKELKSSMRGKLGSHR
jgi:radical SAM enzyme (TIGR01210 family)